MSVTGKDLIDLGFPSGKALGDALTYVRAQGLEGDALSAWVQGNMPAPTLTLQSPAPDFSVNIAAENDLEAINVADVTASMRAIMQTPTVRGGAVMPDACPTGPVGTIPVGGVVVAQGAIHPGMHSADICCSVMLTEFESADPKTVLDAVHKATHFGPGGRPNGQRYTLSFDLIDAFRENMFLRDDKILRAAVEQMGTQGDGNHFAYVGRSAATGRVCLITHHGSRGPGAGLYKLGMGVAERFRKLLSPKTLPENAWIPTDTPEGVAYWEALQLIRRWTKANHNAIHQAATVGAGAKMRDRFWNEHNFVFRRGDLFYHAKGATPVAADFLPDTNGIQIVPLNMGEPILLVRGDVTANNLGFAPHGVGRNMSRSAYKRGLGEYTDAGEFARETEGLDVRFYSGNVDVAELPSAYKPAATVTAQMAQFGLATVVDEILPYGSIMVGDLERDMPWRNKRGQGRPN